MKHKIKHKDHAKHLRQHMTDAENRIWYYLRNRRLGGYKFIRQVIIGSYIADFLCRERKLIVELDGGHHMQVPIADYDKRRTLFFERHRYRVFRIWNNEVFENTRGVLETLLSLLNDGDAT